MTGVFKQRHKSRKYTTYCCGVCSCVVGMKEKDRWLLKMDVCKNGHEIDWTKEEVPDRPFWWLPLTDSQGDKPICDTCASWDKCGRHGHLCGSWSEGTYQLRMF